MDPRLRLHHGFVADPTSHLMAGGAPLQDLSSINLLHSQLAARQDLAQARLQGGVPAAGQGFYTVESLQASAVPRPEDLARQSQLFGVGQQGYDSLALSHALAQQAASAGISIAAGQQGLDAAGLSHLLAQQAANQRLIGGYAGSGLQSLSTEALAQLAQQVASQRLGQQGLDNPALAHLRMQQAARLGQNLPPLTGLSAYGQPDVSLASARLGMLAPQDVTLLLLEREKRLKEILLEQERERYREQDRQRERLREKDRRAERDRERGRDSDRRKKRETSTDKRDTPEKRDSRGVLLIRRLPDPLDKEKGKTSESHDKKEKTWCHLCQLLCTSQDMFEKHVAGKQHKLRVQAEAEAEVLKVELSKSKDSKAKRDDKSSKGDKDKTRKEKVKDTPNTKEKPREKRNRHRRKSKSDKMESKSKSDEPVPEEKPIILKTDEGTEKIQEVLENPILPETGEESEKAQGVLEQLGSETDATHKIEIESKEVQIEVEDSNIHGTTDSSVKEKESDVATQGEGVESVLGKRTLEVAGDPPLAKKTRKGKVAAAAPGTVRCEVCKLTCRNAAVYETHLVGEKHAERLKKAQDQAVTQT